jgi:hypothetical protein
VNENQLRELADRWEAQGIAVRKKSPDVSTALIGCAQALRNLLDPEPSE